MKRYEHFWWPTCGQTFPARVAILSVEGNPLPAVGGNPLPTEQLARWCLCSIGLQRGAPVSRKDVRGDSVTGLWTAIAAQLTSKERLWLFVIDAGRVLPIVDFWSLLERGTIQLAGKDWKSTIDRDGSGEDRRDGVCIIDDPPTVILCQLPPRPGKLLILDVRNWGMQTEGMPDGCERQVDYFRGGISAVLSALRTHGRVSLRCTAASQAVSSLRSRDECRRLHVHTSSRALRLERNAYVGGRCECYHIGRVTGPVYHLDVKSMYPAVARELAIPCTLRRFVNGPAGQGLARESGASNCIAHVQVRTERAEYSCKAGGVIVFPTGVFNTYLCGPELSRAVANGAVTRWHSCAAYSCSPVLTGLYDWWLARLEAAERDGRTLEVQWIKAVCRSLIGKFGEPGRRWIPAPFNGQVEPFKVYYAPGPDDSTVRYRNLGLHTQREEVNDESYWSMPAVAAFVTAAARARLWDYLQCAGLANVYYCDTDSLFTNRQGRDNLAAGGAIRPSSVGYLRQLGQYDWVILHGLRHYETPEKVVCAGVPKGDIRPGESRATYFVRAKAAAEIAAGIRPTGSEQLIAYPGPEPYRHGSVMPDGTVKPLELWE